MIVRYVTTALAIILLAAAMPAQANSTYSGTYAAGTPVSYLVIDACGTGGLTDGIDSSCVAISPAHTGLGYDIFAFDASGLPVGASVCFYTGAGAFLECDSSAIPWNAAFLSVSSFSGVQVSWNVNVHEVTTQ